MTKTTQEIIEREESQYRDYSKRVDNWNKERDKREKEFRDNEKKTKP